jgi:LPXTG-site transpeptidase (sortase) family protein
MTTRFGRLSSDKKKLGLQLGLLYIVVVFIFGFPLLRRNMVSRAIAQLPPVETLQEPIQGTPQRIRIPAVQIDTAVGQGDFTEGTWVSSPNHALFATVTSQLNTKEGNTLIYGHHLPHVFLRTDGLKVGDEAIVETDSEYSFVYRYTDSRVVKPTDVSVFEYHGEPRLTLLTCYGPFSGERRLMFFSLVKVVKK